MKKISMILAVLMSLVSLSVFGLQSCYWYGDGCISQIYCIRGTNVDGNCQMVEICDPCAYDINCCNGIQNPACSLVPYPYPY